MNFDAELLGEFRDAGAKGRVGRDAARECESFHRVMFERTAKFTKELFGDRGLKGRRDVGDGEVALLLGRANDRGLEPEKERS